jgi:hypothetical protein
MTLLERQYGTYAYQCTWRNGRPVNIYLGCGETAQMMAAIDAEARAERDRERQAEHEWEQARDERYAAIDRTLDALTTEARELAHAMLEAAGYYQHARGPWRKRGGYQRQAPAKEA